ncbi:hypothetical protein D3C85_862520 [compost metagenome]
MHAVQAAQAGGDIAQQQAGDQVAAEHPGQATEEGEQPQLQGQCGDQPCQADAAGTQGTQYSATLFQGQADGRMHDEQADQKSQQAQRGQVEVKAVGQALQILGVGGSLQLQLAGEGVGQGRRACGEVLGQQHPRQLPGRMQQGLRLADVDHDHPGGQLHLYLQGRQALAIAAQRPFAAAQAELA